MSGITRPGAQPDLGLAAAGEKEDALKVYEQALAIAPHWRNPKEAADRLKAALAGEAL